MAETGGLTQHHKLKIFCNYSVDAKSRKKPRKTRKNAERYDFKVGFRVIPRLPWLKVLKFMMLGLTSL
jgi:hypothetical protein